MLIMNWRNVRHAGTGDGTVSPENGWTCRDPFQEPVRSPACWMNPPTVFRSRSHTSSLSYHYQARKTSYWCWWWRPLLARELERIQSRVTLRSRNTCLFFKERKNLIALSLFFGNPGFDPLRLSYRSLSMYRTLVNCRNIPTCKAAASIHIPKRCIFLLNGLYSFPGNVALSRSADIFPFLLLLLLLF